MRGNRGVVQCLRVYICGVMKPSLGISTVWCFAQHVGFYEQSSVLSAAACTVGLQAFWWKAWMCMWMRAELGVEYEKWEAAFFKLWRLLVVSCIWR